MAKEIKKRSEMDPKYTWATEDLYKSDALWKEDAQALEKMFGEVAQYSGKLGSSAETLLKFLKLKDEIKIKFSRVSGYAMRKFDEDTKNPVYQDLSSQVSRLGVSYGSALAFEVPELLTISKDVFDKFFSENQELKIYERYIGEITRRKDHFLSEKEEKILAATGEMSDSPSDIMSMFRNADIKFPDVLDEEGKPAKLTAGTFVPMLKSKDRRVRKDAFMAKYNTLDGFKNTAAAAYFGHIKSLMFYAKQRKYNSTLEAALDVTDVPVNVYKNLISAVHDNMHYMHKYVSLRKKLLKVDELHMYDLYTSMVPGADAKISFEEAKKNVMEAVAPLGKEYQGILQEGFDNRWIDVYENDGKRSGAYSAGSYVHPYVLLNHNDNLNSEFTLAHEMGHALHSYLSNKTQPVVYSNYKIFVAEVASTFNEALLMEHLLGKTTDKMEKATLINHFLEQFRTTIYRQTMFAEF